MMDHSGTDHWHLDTSTGIAVSATTDGDNDIFVDFFSAYDSAFVLPDEKEGIDGFRICLALNAGNDGERLKQRYGPFREIVLVARDRETGLEIGGANFICFLFQRPAPLITTNLNYVFVRREARNRGYFRKLVGGIPDVARAVLGAQGTAAEHLTFFEQNDPYKMSPEQYSRDTEVSGIDQFDRVAMWARLGAKIIDFPYVQPPLSADQEADDTLAYGVLGAPESRLDACILRDHLERFFAISVLKGRDVSADPTASKQIAMLSDGCKDRTSIGLLNPISVRREIASSASLRDALNFPSA